MHDQSEYDIRCEWGRHGVRSLSRRSDVVIIVDVLSFSTTIDIATGRGAIVYPYKWKDYSSETFAADNNAELARSRGKGRYSLSPESFLNVPEGTKIVLPSPNGSSLSLMAGKAITLAGCLRNAAAVAAAANRLGETVAVIPAGELWRDGSVRPALEDWLGAGAIIRQLEGHRSPEAQAAAESFETARTDVLTRLLECSSGRELIEHGYRIDVELAAEVDVSSCVPRLADGAYQADG